MAWYNTHIIQGFLWTWQAPEKHSGVDLAEAQGTPLTSPVDGEVLHAGFHPWGGQVDIVYNDQGQTYTMSFLHMSRIDVQAGRAVHPGDQIGLSGGDNLPRKYSRGHHLHFEIWVGRGAPYIDYSPWRPKTDHHPIDPIPFWQNIRDHGIGSGSSDPYQGNLLGLGNPFPCPKPDWWPSIIPYPRDCSGSGDNPNDTGGAKDEFGPQRAHDVLQEFPGFIGIVAAIDDIEKVTPFQPPEGLINTPQVPGYVAGWVIGNTAAIAVRVLISTLGLIMLLILILAAVRRPVAEALDTSSQFVTGRPAPISNGMRNAGPIPGTQAAPPAQPSAQGQPTAPQGQPVQNRPVAPARVSPANAPTVPMKTVP